MSIFEDMYTCLKSIDKLNKENKLEVGVKVKYMKSGNELDILIEMS